MSNQQNQQANLRNSDFYYNDLLNQNLQPAVDDQEKYEENVIKFSDASESKKNKCVQKIKSIMNNEKFILVISKLVVLMTGMIGPLFLFIQDSGISEIQTFFGYQQLDRNDYPFQKVFFRYLILVAFLYYKQLKEKQPKNSRDFISGQETAKDSIKEHALLGLLDFVQVQCFVFSLGYTSVLRAYLFSGIQLAILLLLKKKEGAQIYTSEYIAFFMALAAKIAIASIRVNQLNKEESLFYGDFVALIGGFIGSQAYFRTNFKQKDYYNFLYQNHQFSLGYSLIFVILFDTSGFLIDFDNTYNLMLLILIGCIECIATIKKIKTFVFMRYFKNIFEPFVGFKFEYLFGLPFLDTWTILIIFGVLFVPANFIMLSKHASDIRNNTRHRDSTFVDVLNFEEYIEMKEIHSPEPLNKSRSNQKS
ncbi:hypothetical protein ABPG72_019413 [Tetrahymena utriculariae]